MFTLLFTLSLVPIDTSRLVIIPPHSWIRRLYCVNSAVCAIFNIGPIEQRFVVLGAGNILNQTGCPDTPTAQANFITQLIANYVYTDINGVSSTTGSLYYIKIDMGHLGHSTSQFI